jgi:hypothetical protein
MKILAAVLVLSLPAVACDRGDPGTERWATTENTNVQIDWDKVNEAYKLAEGPEDFEKRVNEIYAGDEVISVAVQDTDAKVQEVTGFFDKNGTGAVDEGEKIFVIKREITGDGSAQVQTHGYGPYAYYHSPMMSIVSGMLIGSMMSRAFMPGYMPMTYTTSPARGAELRGQRNAYRQRNPSQFRSGSGRQYNAPRSTPRGGGGFRGGGRFGITRAARTTTPVRLTA